MQVNTVLGPVDSADLGVTLMHEHISLIDMNLAFSIPGWHDREAVIRDFCEEMDKLKPLGVKTFVDATPMNAGRDILMMQECSRRTGVNIIACSGLYWQEQPWFSAGRFDPEMMADIMAEEAEKGMQGTDAKPGFLKCATGKACGKSEVNQAMVKAVAIASKKTGLPIYTHSVDLGDGFFADYQKKIFLDEGVNPKRMAFGHVNTLPGQDPRVDGLLEGGSYIGIDQLGYFPLDMMETTAKGIAGLRDTDAFHHMFFSCDVLIETDMSRAITREHRDRVNSEPDPIILKDVRKKTLYDTFFPMLKDAGLTDDDIQTVMVDNPRRFFEGA
jgi:phosphotriesterase-related protein